MYYELHSPMLNMADILRCSTLTINEHCNKKIIFTESILKHLYDVLEHHPNLSLSVTGNSMLPVIQMCWRLPFLMLSTCITFQYEKVTNFISTAKSEGATILYGGKRPQVKLITFSTTAAILDFSFFLSAD